MTNSEIADRLEQAAKLLEIQDAKFFRVQAYRNAALTVRDSADDITERVAAGADLTALDYIGKDLAAGIETLCRGGELPALSNPEVPLTLLDLVRIPGLGPKKARRLWIDLGIETLDDLATALEDGLVSTLDGFGPATEEKLKRRVARLRS